MGRPSNINVPDHVVVRYLERVLGIDVDAVRDAVRTAVRPDMDAGAHRCVVGDATYVIDPQERVVTTVVVRTHRIRRTPRDFRKDEE